MKIGGVVMSLINKKEKEMLRAIALKMIAEKSNKHSFETEKNSIVESYYRNSSQNMILKQYSFETIAELRSELTELWQYNKAMQDFIPVVLASAFKLHQGINEPSMPIIEHIDADSNEVLPVYTYTL